MKRYAGVLFGILLAGCTPREQQKAANTAEKGLDKAGNVAVKALDKGAKVVTDASITAAVKTRYAATTGVPAATIDVTTQNHIVTLTGKVPNQYSRNLAIQIAKSTVGVKKVVPRLKIAK